MSPNARFRRGLLKCLFSRTATLELQKNRQIGALGHSFHFGIAICGNSRELDPHKLQELVTGGKEETA